MGLGLGLEGCCLRLLIIDLAAVRHCVRRWDVRLTCICLWSVGVDRP
jgi:hypothetical protein